MRIRLRNPRKLRFRKPRWLPVVAPWLRGIVAVVLLVGAMILGLPLYLAGLGGEGSSFSEPLPPLADLPIRVDREEEGVQVIPLEEYVKGVVAAEMPASFHLEALRAQAVAARTYAVRRMRIFGGPGCSKNPDADVCVDPERGQAFADRDELWQRWGPAQAPLHWRNIEEAVESTRGLILMYDGIPIDAVYHSTSGGRTASAEEVWGRAVPYLQSVPSPHESHAPRLEQTFRIPLPEVLVRLGLDPTEAEVALGTGEPLFEAERTPQGRVQHLRVAGRTIPGTEVRSRLDLPSTWFAWELDGQQLTFRVRGFGHGVGMSQYGADGMAANGSTYVDILQHYYPGTTLRPIFLE